MTMKVESKRKPFHTISNQIGKARSYEIFAKSS